MWFDAFMVGFLAFVVFAATAQYHDPLNNDARATALAAWQLAHHGNATLTPFRGHFGWLYLVHGRFVTDRLPGTVFFAAPLYLALGTSAYPDIYPGTLAASLASATAVALCFALCCRIVSRRVAAVAAALLALATATWTVSADELWTHGPGQAAVLLTLLLCSRERWLAAGVPAGFAVLVRPHLAVVAFVLGAIESVRRRSLRPLLVGVGALAGGLILLAYNHAVWGRYTVFGGYSEPAVSGHLLRGFFINIAGALVSPERGLLVMTPAILLLLPGLRAAWRVAPWWARAGAVAGLGYAAAQLAVIRFSGGNGFYSYRTTLEALTLFMPLFALAWQEWTSRSRLRRTLFASLATASVALHALGAVVNWSPPGSHSPWRSFQPIDLLRHVTTGQAAGWVVGSAVCVTAAGWLTWRSQGEAPPDARSALHPTDAATA